MLSIIKFFRRALDTEAIRAAFPGGVWPIARPEADEEADIRPYLIIAHMGANAEQSTKDGRCPSLATATVTITVAADDPDELMVLTELVEDTIQHYANCDYDDDEELHEQMRFYVDDLDPSEGEAFYDDFRPCYAQLITYACDTTPKDDE